jgi:SAM-dependent methyltransferase
MEAHTMTHHSSGLHRILDQPQVYERFQRLLGAHAARQRIVRDFLRPFEGARILDVGCGTGSLLDYLPEDVDYVGCDLNPIYIESARQRYGDRGRFFCARAGQEDAGGDFFDFVVAKSLLHHLSDGEADGLLSRSSKVLRPGGVFFSSDPVRHEGQSVITRLLLSLDRGRSIRTPDAYRGLIRPYFQEIEATLVTDLLGIPYSHFIMRARISGV